MNESQREANLDGSGVEEKLGGVEEQEAIIKIYYVRKKSIFSYNKKSKETFIAEILNIKLILKNFGN